MLHPIMPFITEELWHRLEFGKGRMANAELRIRGEDSILASKWPEPLAVDDTDIGRVEAMRELIVAVRNIRSELRVPVKTRADCVANVADPGLVEFLRDNAELVRVLARVGELRFGDERPAQSSMAVIPGGEAYVPLAGLIDVEQETVRIHKEIENIRKVLKGIDAKFANRNFVARANPEVVENERKRKAEFEDRTTRLERQLEALKR